MTAVIAVADAASSISGATVPEAPTAAPGNAAEAASRNETPSISLLVSVGDGSDQSQQERQRLQQQLSDPLSTSHQHPKDQEETGTDATAESAGGGGGSGVDGLPENNTPAAAASSSPGKPIVSSSKKSRPPYKYDPNKITLRFLFANRDGLTVTVECNPSDTIGDVKGALISVWPEDVPKCGGGENLRLVCMGKGYLMPDTRTLEDCQVPVFKTHPTPVNVSIKPDVKSAEESKKKAGAHDAAASNSSGGGAGGFGGHGGAGNTSQASQGCACSIL